MEGSTKGPFDELQPVDPMNPPAGLYRLVLVHKVPEVVTAVISTASPALALNFCVTIAALAEIFPGIVCPHGRACRQARTGAAFAPG